MRPGPVGPALATHFPAVTWRDLRLTGAGLYQSNVGNQSLRRGYRAAAANPDLSITACTAAI